MRKKEITIQYFVDRGRRRTLTFSLQRLNAILIGSLVFCIWSLALTGFFVFHLFKGNSLLISSTAIEKGIAAVVAVGPDQPARKKVETATPSIAKTSLAAKLVETEIPPPQTTSVAVIPQEPIYTLASLMKFESSLRKAESPDPLRFRNVRIALDGDHLRVSADIEKVMGDSVEGHSFVAVEYLDKEGRSVLVTSHGKKDWESAIAPNAFASATSFRAKFLTKKRFDIVHPLNEDGKLVALKLVARDKKTGKTIVEAVSLPD